ncbi:MULTISPECIES: response regulator [unclassified Rubrivivax]|uniref:response regulator n=1 Tax=unclassified Rubrivivax TaxID=2649762 RepID=UPI0013E91082|nr:MULTISPECIES: response regulator [unclassified Rubrivivax]MCC9597555.1 response regulator [Rubrivivax sp. JA1055]MCC9646187.1 response regulator [Rubrivivax sp. JA1029]MCD0416483.1 response regulator [Rubrivivax sp. JA1024]
MAPASNSSEAADRPCVLFVDDSVTMRRSIELTLQTGGYEVVTASDGTVALALLREGLRPDLLLTDIVMPGTDGLTLIREARKLLRFTPIVALTTQGAPEMRQQGRADGATAWLLKPTGGRGLLELVARFVQRAPQAPAV